MAELKRAVNEYTYFEPARKDGWDRRAEADRERRARDEEKRRARQQPERVEVVYEMHPALAAKRKSAVLNCVAILVCFAMLVAVVSGYAAISKINLENITIRGNIDDLEAEAEKLNVEIALNSDISDVAQKAENDLNMSFPEQAQIRYIKLEDTKTEILQDTVNEEGFFEGIWNSICSVFK